MSERERESRDGNGDTPASAIGRKIPSNVSVILLRREREEGGINGRRESERGMIKDFFDEVMANITSRWAKGLLARARTRMICAESERESTRRLFRYSLVDDAMVGYEWGWL